MTTTSSNKALLSDQGFWSAAFDPTAPFSEQYRSKFPAAILNGDVSVLDAHREAIFYLQPQAVWPVVRELLVIAADHSEASFIESLDHYLQDPAVQQQLASSVTEFSSDVLQLVRSSVERLVANLHASGDEHLTCGFEWMASALSERARN